MKVFTSNDFPGRCPVGTAAVIVARDRRQARKLLDAALPAETPKVYTLCEVRLGEPRAIILCDGDY